MNETNEKPLRITHLIQKDFKRVESVEIVPGDKTLILVHGPNEQGKTSILDGIIAAVGGGRKSPAMSVRKGAESAVNELWLSDEEGPKYRIVRTATDSDSTLRVYDVSEKIPASLKAPQKLLDSFIADISFDPLKFMRAGKDEAMKLLLSAVGMLATYEKYQSQRRGLLDARNEAERKLAQENATVASMPHHPDVKDRKSDDEARAAVNAANAHNTSIDDAEDDIQRLLDNQDSDARNADEGEKRMVDSIAKMEASLKASKEQLKEMQKARAEIEASYVEQIAEARKVREGLGVKKTADDMMQSVEAVAAHNRKVDENERRAAAESRVNAAKKAFADIQKQVEELDAKAREDLESSPIGAAVPGLVVKDDGIYHNDVPIEQASGMRKLELSLLVGMAANPRLRVMCVDEIDRVDDDSLKRIVAFCKKNKYQLWGTAVRVTSSDDDFALIPVSGGKAELLAT